MRNETKKSQRQPATDWLEQSKKINNEILLYEKMNDTAYFNQSTLSDESKDGWLKESKKINDGILSYEKMNGKVSWLEEVEAESKKINDEILSYEKMNGKVSWLKEVEVSKK